MKKREIPGFEGLYTISDEGQVWSIRKNQPVSIWLNRTGYSMVTVWKNCKRKHFALHTLLLTVFVGERPSPKHQGCHDNGNKADNRLNNLRWDTVRANHLDKKAHGTFQEGEKHGRHKFTDEQVLEMRASEETHTYWARKFGVTPEAVAYARNIGWKHLNATEATRRAEARNV